jgi:hypothetical protein
MVREPNVFLFDEPLSNLDAGLRAGTEALVRGGPSSWQGAQGSVLGMVFGPWTRLRLASRGAGTGRMGHPSSMRRRAASHASRRSDTADVVDEGLGSRRLNPTRV